MGIRDGAPWFKCFRAKAGCDKLTYWDIERMLSVKLPIVRASDLVKKYTAPRPTIIEGLVRRGDVMNIVGGPKARKSFLVMQLALAVANGAPFLGRATTLSRVLMIDNELRGDDLARRLDKMSQALGVSVENIDIMPLRGRLTDVHSITRSLLAMPPESYGLIIVDALYKSLPSGTDENSNSNMTAVYCVLDEAAERTNAALSVVHHTSKGTQKSKSVTDMGAGAGAQSRSADVHLVLRDHEADDTVVMEAVLRSQSPIDPICIEFEYPLWKVAQDKDPANVALAGNRKASPSIEAFLETIPIEPSRKTETLAISKNTLNASRAIIDALYAESLKRGEIIEKERTQFNQPIIIERVKK